MKRLICLFALMIASAIHSADVPLATAFNPTSTTLLSVPTLTTNSTTTAVAVDRSLYHAFQFVNSGTGAVQVAIDRTIDPLQTTTNWIAVSTNSVSGGTTSETSFVGKWSYVRIRFYGTNNAASAYYLGGR